MARLHYTAICSLDGYIEDETGAFDWSAPDDEVHQFVNDLVRPMGTHLYGRRMYETLAVWETMDTPDQTEVVRDFARVWQTADKVVYSRTLDTVATARTRIERTFDLDAVGALKAGTDRDLTVGGAELAGEMIRAGLVDEIHLFLNPIIVGGGKAALPKGVRIELELSDERRFDNGVVYVRYAVR
jgi:dihydrofolate reductase